ncbi:MAG: DUF4252 domain-containing protein [Bacteroidales bacterium]|nr:DUF4252 domain-containing protein [Bacteroidales bacterium]
MKHLLFGMFFALCAFMLYGQNSAVDQIFDKYSGKEGYTTVYISSYMFNLINKLESDDPGYNDFKKATSGINSIRILTQEGEGSVAFGKELLAQLPRSEYKEMMVVKEENEDVLFLAKEKDGKISEFLLIVSGGGEDALIAIQGDIDLESIAGIAQGLDMPGLENLEELE